MTATFVSKLNGDDINHVYGCMLDPNGLECSYSVCNFETFMVGTDTYLTVHSVIDLSVQDPVANGNNENACGFVIVQVSTFWTHTMQYPLTSVIYTCVVNIIRILCYLFQYATCFWAGLLYLRLKYKKTTIQYNCFSQRRLTWLTVIKMTANENNGCGSCVCKTCLRESCVLFRVSN